MSELCPCGKNKSFAACCGRFIRGEDTPKTPEQLMRSRYSAYSLGNYGEYLLKTWFPLTAKGLSAEELSQRLVDYQRLEVLEKTQQGDEGTVEFKAYFIDPAKNNTEGVLHEKSEFKRMQGRWFYVGGRVG